MIKLALKKLLSKKYCKTKHELIKFDPANEDPDFDPRGPLHPIRWTAHLNLDNIKILNNYVN